MSFSVFFYASPAPKEDSYKYESRAALHQLLCGKRYELVLVQNSFGYHVKYIFNST